MEEFMRSTLADRVWVVSFFLLWILHGVSESCHLYSETRINIIRQNKQKCLNQYGSKYHQFHEETTIYHSQFSTCTIVPSCNVTPRQFVSEFSSTICKTLFSKLKVRTDIDLP